jgi:AcrR family transcriptional regulator
LKASTPRGIDTRNLILDVAERLFAENGPAAVTVRTIALAANINTQAVNYHFGSKERLFEEMFGRRVWPVNRERLERLDDCMRRGRTPSIEELVDAFVRPILHLRMQSSGHERALVVMQFQARAVSNPGEAEFSYLKVHFEPLRSRFISALSAILPHLTIEDVIWRYNFMCGAILYSMAGPMRMLHPPESMAGLPLRDSDNEESTIAQLVRFLAAGFGAASLYKAAEVEASAQTGTVTKIRKKTS